MYNRGMRPRTDARPWLFGPAPDLLIGCGLWYVAFFLVLCVSGEQGSTVIMGLKQYLQARDRASREEQQREVSAKK